MKTPILATIAASLAIVTILTALPAQTRTQPAVASDKELIQSDPYRPSFDMWGNQWSYDGKLMHAACPNVPDPISHKDNPECKAVKKPAPKPVANKSVQCGVGK